MILFVVALETVHGVVLLELTVQMYACYNQLVADAALSGVVKPALAFDLL